MKILIPSLAALLMGAVGVCVAAPQTHTVVHPGEMPSRVGAHTTFTGQVRHDSIARADENCPVSLSIVTFEPGARTFWHTHPAGQRLVILQGEGWIGTADGRTERVHPGDNVWCPPGIKHWHGASEKTAMAHLAVTPMKDGRNVTWLEEVKTEDYLKARETK